MQWMLMPYRKLYSVLAGRSSRKEFWMFFLFNFLVFVAVFALIVGMVGSAASLADMKEMSNPAMLIASMGAGVMMMVALMIPLYAWFLLTVIAWTALVVRRFHDMNVTGWAYLAFIVLGFVPLLNFLLFFILLGLMCIKGTDGPNNYGPDPTQPADPQIFA